MLNREDVRKVLEAHSKLVREARDNGVDMADMSMREVQEAVLEQIMIQDKADKPKG